MPLDGLGGAGRGDPRGRPGQMVAPGKQGDTSSCVGDVTLAILRLNSYL